MKILPAIDIIGGKCVRLKQGDFGMVKEYSDDPLKMAKHFASMGLEYLHLVDLDGARLSQIQNLDVLKSIAKGTKLKIDFSGGINSLESAEMAFEAGANQIAIGSLAVKDPKLFAELLNRFGPEKIILSADSRNRKIAIKGWLEDSENDILTFIRSLEKQGVSNVICTSISRDGAMQGPDLDLYSDIMAGTKVKLIASGGIRSTDDLEVLKKLGCDGAIVGTAIYEGQIEIKDLQSFC